MLSLFKKRLTSAELTFKARVERFWEWYASVADRFYQVIEQRRSPELAPEVSAKVDELIPGFAWVFGPGANGVGHSFTLSGEGVLHKQLLAIEAVKRAPQLEGWTFYDSRQPGAIDGMALEIDGKRFEANQYWITPLVNDEEQKVDITVWHPLFKQMTSPQERLGPVFIMLDEALGEFGTGQWIGEINTNDTKLADAFPLTELSGYTDRLAAERDWKKLAPGEASILYRFEQQRNRFLRDDIVVGSTMHAQLLNEYLKAQGQLSDPLSGTGADYVFASFDIQFLPAGNETTARAVIEDALDAALKTESSGRLLGGALGTRFAYIDLLLLDGKTSLGIVQQVLREQNLPPGTAINFFAKEKKSQRIVH